MLEFRHILFPTDFSEQCKAFRKQIQFVGRAFNARVTVLHVVPVMSGGEYGDLAGMFPTAGDFAAVEEKMGSLLIDFSPDQEFAGIPEFTREVSLGDPAVVIADYAINRKVDLIMMPTHGYGRFRSLLMGSVASKVLHDAECPVWTAAHGAPHGEGPDPKSHVGVKNIIAGLDLAKGQLDAIGAAGDLARKFDASVRLVHAVPAAEHVPGDTGGDEFGQFLIKAAREHIERLQAKTGTTFDVAVEPGDVASVIRKTALRTNSDLVVLGRGVVHAPLGRLRSKAYEIIRESPCPVLSL